MRVVMLGYIAIPSARNVELELQTCVTMGKTSIVQHSFIPGVHAVLCEPQD